MAWADYALECARVRSSVICVVLLVAVAASADVIHLKNGRTIVAEHARENGDRVEYQIGDDTYRIPRSAVETIESSGNAAAGRAASETAAAVADLPALIPDAPPAAAGLDTRLVHDGRVDPDVLRAIEAEGDARTSAWAYAIAGAHEQEHGNTERAATYYRRGLSLAPDTAVLEARYASLLLTMQRVSEAVPHAERAVKISPESADFLAIEGFAYFLADRSREAIAPWKRSLAIRPNATVRDYLARAQRELSAEGSFGRDESSHFTLKYEGREVAPALRHELLTALEADYNDLVAELGAAPRESIVVVLYTNQAFFDVTQAPSWADAVNDGKLRIPLERVQSLTPDLSRVLRHELTHTFIDN